MRGRRLTAVLAVLVLAVAFLLVRVELLQRSDTAAIAGALAAEPDGRQAVLTGEGASRSAVAAATTATERLLSFSYESFVSGRRSAERLLAPRARPDYREAMNAIARDTRRGRVTRAATVVDAAVVSATSREAVVLLFVDTSTTSRGRAEPVVEQQRVLVRLDRDGGPWLVTDLSAQ